MLDVALVGCGGMMPLPKRFLTGLFLRLNGRFLLIDCGEGAQVSLKLLGWGFKNIDIIMFTHFHADHIAGLPGLLLTIGNTGRTEPIKLIGPKGLEFVVKSLTVIARELPFDLEFYEMNCPSSFDIGDFHINSLSVEHRIACFAYSVKVKRPGKFDAAKASALDLPKIYWSVLQRGESVVYEGETYLPHMVMGDERKGIKVTYCTDSRPLASLTDFAENSDLFICEGLYGDNEKLDKAKEYKHMTFVEAAAIAKSASVKEMWLTHYSPSLSCPGDFIDNALNIFPNSHIGYDRKTCTLLFEQDS